MQLIAPALLLAVSTILYGVYLMRAEFNKDRHAIAWYNTRLHERNKENLAYFDLLRSNPDWNQGTGHHRISSLMTWKEMMNS